MPKPLPLQAHAWHLVGEWGPALRSPLGSATIPAHVWRSDNVDTNGKTRQLGYCEQMKELFTTGTPEHSVLATPQHQYSSGQMYCDFISGQ